MTQKTERIVIVETLIGIFAVTEKNEIIEETLYPTDPKRIAAALEKQVAGEISNELRETLEKSRQRGFKNFALTNQALVNTLKKAGFDSIFVESSDGENFVRSMLEDLAINRCVVQEKSQLFSLSREVSILRTKKALKDAQTQRGATISHSVQLLNELDKVLNVLSGKLREWYGIHFPELDRLIDNHRTYAEIVSQFADRNNITDVGLERLKLGDKTKRILNACQVSMGAPLITADSVVLKQLSQNLISLYTFRTTLELHIATVTEEIAPNLSKVAGPVLGAKLIEKAGGIRKLAMMPSSTLQILGAEKALFRSKKTRAKPPKHGLIFQHPFIHSKPKHLRGRAARTLAFKLSLAARADAFSGNPIGEELKKQLENEN